MKSQTVIWMLIIMMWSGFIVGLMTYHFSYQCPPKEEYIATVTYYKEGCHLESCAKKYTFPRKMDTDFYDYNFTFDKPVKIIRLNYYKRR